MKLNARALSLSLFLFPVSVVHAESLMIDPAKSTTQFSVSNMGVKTVKGSIKVTAGKIEYDAKDPTKSVVLVTMDPASIDTEDGKRDEHLRSKDFFDVSKYPQMTFVTQTIVKEGDHYLMTGALAIKSVLKSVQIPFTFAATTVKGKTHVKGHGTTKIKREDFDITYGNAFMIGHDVSIDLAIETK